MALPSTAAPPIQGLVQDEIFRFDVVLEFEQRELNALTEIWAQKSEGKSFVTRADFDARTVKPYMRNLFILDVVRQPDSSRRYRYRYMGSALVEVFGEQTGRYLDEFIPAKKLVRWTAAHDLIVMSKRPMRFLVNYASPQISFLKGECLMLPLYKDEDTVDMIMGFNYINAKRN